MAYFKDIFEQHPHLDGHPLKAFVRYFRVFHIHNASKDREKKNYTQRQEKPYFWQGFPALFTTLKR
jgi:hypothetical protein